MDGSNMQECMDVEESQNDIISLSQTPIITKALALQKHTFLGQEEWKRTPWADDPASKSPGHFLQDIFAHIPGLLEDGNYLMAQKASKLTNTTTTWRNMARD